MNQFIAFNDELNITNEEPDDVFSYLAGGEFYANTFAAGAGYAIGRLSNINYTSIFLPFFIDEISSMMELNEDFVELALMPMRIAFYKTAGEKRREREALDELTDDVEDIIRTAEILHEKSGGRVGFSPSAGVARQGATDGNFTRELFEQRQKSVFKQALQDIAYAKFGAAGAIAAGWAYDGRVSGAVVADTVGRVTTAKVADALAGVLGKALGIQTGFATLGLSMAIGSLLTEAFEVASGLDMSFGFGGELQGYSLNTPLFSRPVGFWRGLAELVGLADRSPDLVDRYGNLRGYKTGDTIVEYGRNDFATARKAGFSFETALNRYNVDDLVDRAFGRYRGADGYMRDRSGNIGGIDGRGGSLADRYGARSSMSPAQRTMADAGYGFAKGVLDSITKDIVGKSAGGKSSGSNGGKNRSFGEKTGYGKTSRSEKSRERQSQKNSSNKSSSGSSSDSSNSGSKAGGRSQASRDRSSARNGAGKSSGGSGKQ